MLMPKLHARAQQQTEARLGMAAVELACTLPILVFCSMITVDFARIVYAQVALQNWRGTAPFTSYTPRSVHRCRPDGRAWSRQ